VQRLVSLHADCDADAVLARVLPAGPVLPHGRLELLRRAADTGGTRCGHRRARAEPAGSYTQRLLADANLRLKKLGEEAVELALACERGIGERAAEEAADLLYHALVACRAAGVDAAAVLAALERRGARRRHPPSVGGRGAAPLQQQAVQRQQDDGAEDRDAERAQVEAGHRAEVEAARCRRSRR
jgi:phosphoribosyl-AMP cyclohydrolase / phosphoribosyl-ATP pyrophosphohydrolase